jgi:hypothetical protein
LPTRHVLAARAGAVPHRLRQPEDIHRRAAHSPSGVKVGSVHDLENCNQQSNREGVIVVTFIVNEQGSLCVGDRSSEHISCSGGHPVLAAGEMFFRPSDSGLEVVDVSNQSTGICPEPESWPGVATALDRVGIPHPGRFTQMVGFRRCPACSERNIVKDDWFGCGVCGADLPAARNF